jgi:hypothetical protein
MPQRPNPGSMNSARPVWPRQYSPPCWLRSALRQWSRRTTTCLAYTPFAGDDPNVAQVGAGWMMTYRDSSGNLSYTTSQDGIRWTSGVEVVNSGSIGMSIYWSSLVVKDATAYLFFEAGGGTTDASWSLA